jgi:ribulose-5-phosphate 4-epimerase/fuculose-1-phosphate aldolase
MIIRFAAATLSLLLALPAAAQPSAGAPDRALIDDLVAANRILYDQGVVDAFGHVSARHDKDPTHFLLARNLAPALVTAEDILEYDADGNPLNAAGKAVYLERFIHAEIYKARPDVKSVVHTHSASLIPFGIAQPPLRAVYHMGSFLGAGGVPVWDIRKNFGDTDMLVRNNALGADLARTLGPSTTALMRGHGSVAVGDGVRQAVYRAIYMEANARLQAEAMRLGPVTYLTAEEAAKAAASTEGQAARPWELWKKKAMGK